MSVTNMIEPPHDTDAERSLIGAILLDSVSEDKGRVWDICQAKHVTADFFYDAQTRMVYEAMTELVKTNRPIDSNTVSTELHNRNRMNEVDAKILLQKLVDSMPTSAHAEYYLNQVMTDHMRRRVIACARAAINTACDGTAWIDPGHTLSQIEQSFGDIEVGQDRVEDWRTTVAKACDDLQASLEANGQRINGLPTGLVPLDHKLFGLKPGEMVVIAARTSVGKTSLAMNIAERTASAGIGVMVFSLEMSAVDLARRMAVGHTGVDLWALQTGTCSKAAKERFRGAIGDARQNLANLPIHVDASEGLDITELRGRARRQMRKEPFGLVIIDYLQLCSANGFDTSQGAYNAVTHISRQIKGLAKELSVPVIVLSQLSRPKGLREDEGDQYQQPRLSELRDSGAIEQDADVVLLMHRAKQPKTEQEKADAEKGEETVINVAKNRNGTTGEIHVHFDRVHTRFCDID